MSLTATYDIWWSAFGSKIGCIVQINCLKCKRQEEKSQIKMEMDLKTHKTCKNTLNNHRGFSNLVQEKLNKPYNF